MSATANLNFLITRHFPSEALPVAIIPSSRPRPSSPRAQYALALLVLLGFGLRIAALFTDRCLWIDEAMLASNLIERTPAQLLEPLDWNQGAPIGFLLLSKFAVLAFGTEEWSLRLVPFLGSLLGLLLFAWLAPRILSRAAALLAIGLFAVSPSLVNYAAECKQYETDATVAVGLLATAAGLLRSSKTKGWWFVLAAGGAVAVWLSHPAIFVLAGIGTALTMRAARDRDRSTLLALFGTIVCWSLSFAGFYFICLRHLGANNYLLEYWASFFLPLPPRSAEDLMWIFSRTFGFFRMPGGFEGEAVPTAALAATLAVVGLWHLARRRGLVAAALVLPVGFALLASALHRYPFGGRLLLFLVPSALLLVVAGAEALVQAAGSGRRVVSVILLGALATAPVFETVNQLRNPPRREELGPVMEAVRQQWRPGDHIYVYYGARPGYFYYSRKTSFPMGAVTMGEEHRGDTTAYRVELAKLPRSGRLWLLFAHRHGREEFLIRASLDEDARRLESLNKPGAAAYLYQYE